MSIEDIKKKINTILDNSRYGGAGHPKQVYNEIPFPGFEDVSVWRNSDSRVKMIMDDVGDVKGKRILDLGCNIGRFCFEFSKIGARLVSGVDIDRECIQIAIDIAKEFKQDNTLFLQGEVTPKYLENIEGKFDIVLFLSVMNHMPIDSFDFSTRKVFRNLERIGDVLYFEMGGHAKMFPKCPQGEEVFEFLNKYSNFKYSNLGRDDVYHRFMIKCKKMTLNGRESFLEGGTYIKGNKNTVSGYIRKLAPYMIFETRRHGYYSEHYFDIMNRIKNNPHSNIPLVYDVRKVGDEVHVLREYIEGEQIDKVDEVKLGTTLCDILQYCRINDIIHRDFMKQNVIWSKELNKFFLIDWAEASNLRYPCKPVLTNKWMDEVSPMTSKFDEYMISLLLKELKGGE